MEIMKKCIYCGLTSDFNKEHIIPNELGGCLIDSKICCRICNRYLGKIIDEPFQKQFTPIIAHIKNFRKDRKRTIKREHLQELVYLKGSILNSKQKGIEKYYLLKILIKKNISL